MFYTKLSKNQTILFTNRIGGVMVVMFIPRAVDCGFEPRSDQTREYKISICCFSAKHTALRKRANIGWLRIMMCPSRETYLPADCLSELAL